MRWTHGLVALTAAVGAALAAYAYFTPTSGVDGTAGALSALIGAVAVVIGALIAGLRAVPGWGRTTLNVLLVLGTVLTGLAAWMLMQHAFLVAMAVSFFCTLAAIAIPARRRTA